MFKGERDARKDDRETENDRSTQRMWYSERVYGKPNPLRWSPLWRRKAWTCGVLLRSIRVEVVAKARRGNREYVSEKWGMDRADHDEGVKTKS